MADGLQVAVAGGSIGGLCAGQLYLGGDGKLWHWDIFNRRIATDAGHYAKPLKAASPLEQGFALRITSGGKTQEQWMRPEGNSMLGMSRTVVNGKTPFFEFLQIRPDGEDMVYLARPQGKEPTSFKLVKINESVAIFENPQHDFPQRIAYQRQIDGSLLAVIEGEEKGKPKRVEFPMKRVRCD
jgi:hypothetical protein